MTLATRPLVPEDIPAAQRANRSLERAAFAAVRSVALNRNALAVCRDLYPRDARAAELLGLVQRAAQPSGTTSGVGWAAELITQSILPFVMALPTSAAAQLIGMGTAVPMEGRGQVFVPGLAGLPTAAPFVGELGAIPVRQATTARGLLSPRKMAVLLTMSGELAKYGGAEPIFRSMLEAIAAVSLDSAYFSNAAGDATVHEGLLHGLTPIVPASSEPIDVLSALAAAVGAGGSGQVVFVSGPGRAAGAALRTPQIEAVVLPSLACPENRVIGIDPVALVHGAGLPEIDSSEEATFHSADPASPISVTGAPNAVSAPVYSAFQANLIALRLLLPVAFAKLRPGAVAYADGLT